MKKEIEEGLANLITLVSRNQDTNKPLADDENPNYLYSTVWTSLLTDIVNGKIDAKYLAGRELANRGLDKNGLWVGFDKAKEIHGIKS